MEAVEEEEERSNAGAMSECGRRVRREGDGRGDDVALLFFIALPGCLADWLARSSAEQI